MKVGFYVLPKGAKAGARGERIGELAFETARDRDTFARGVSMLTETSMAPLLGGGGSSLEAREAAHLLAKIQHAISSSGESTLSSVMSAEVVALDRGSLEGKLEQLFELLQKAAKTGGLLTTLPE